MQLKRQFESEIREMINLASDRKIRHQEHIRKLHLKIQAIEKERGKTEGR